MDVTADAEPSPHLLVAAEVRAYMGRRRISGRRAALKLGWTPMYLSRRLSGDIPFDVNDLVALAHLLDVPVTAFFAVPYAADARITVPSFNSVSCTPRPGLVLAA